MQALDGKVVPELPAADRDVYIRHVSGTVGLAALAATVVRVAPGLLLSLCSTEAGKAEPVLGELGKLERRVLWQLSLAENWKRDQDAAREAAKGKGRPHSHSPETCHCVLGCTCIWLTAKLGLAPNMP